MPVAMAWPQATWLNGQLHIGGGWTGDNESDRVLISYTPQGKYTTRKTPTTWYGLTNYQSHIVTVGGQEPTSHGGWRSTDKIWLLQQEDWTSDAIPPMPTRRYSPAAIAVGYLLMVAGGQVNNGDDLDVVEVFDNKSKIWRTIETLPRPCSFMSSSLNDRHLVLANRFNGKDVYRCSVDSLSSDPSSLQWESLPDVPYQHSSIVRCQDVLLSLGGGPVYSYWSTTIYFLHGVAWQPIGELPIAVTGHCTTILPSGEVVPIGGYTDSGYSPRVFRLTIRGEL